jgi:quinoprotein glucose dehydrogenase
MRVRLGAVGTTVLASLAGAVAVGAIVVHATSSNAQQTQQTAMLERGNKAGEWRYWGADAWSTRYSPLDQINATNFDSLQVAWKWDAGQYGEDEYYRTTPLYANGRIFTVATTHRKAFGIDPATGKTIWQWGMNEGIRWQKAPRQFAGRGLAYWTDGAKERVVVITPGYHLVSIDAKTGKPDPAFGKSGIVDLEDGLGLPLVPLAVDDTGPNIISEGAPARRAKPGEKWNATTRTGADGSVGIDPDHGEIANSSPAIIVNDVIIVGNSAIHGYYPVRLHNLPAWVRGFDVKTGKQLWRFNLIPQPGEFGAETWENGTKIDTPGMGKVDPWATYSADPELGLVYIPTGMGLNDEYGGHRPGNNLFANSVVAIDVKTGQRKWHYQFVHHDIWDYDTPMAPNLLDVTVNGQRRKVLAQTTKQGFMYVLDRQTGVPIWPIEEKPVLQSDVPGEKTSPTQPIPTRPAPYAQQGLQEADLIDYTPAIKDSALKLAKKCRMGPYFIPAVLADGSGPNGFSCAWYAPGASGGVNIDGGTAADPVTGMVYVGGQSGLNTIEVAHDPCSEHRYSQPHDSCLIPGGAPRPADYKPNPEMAGRGGFGARMPTAIGGVSILKPRQLGGITAYDLNTGDKKWWMANGNAMAKPQTTDPLFAGVDLPLAPVVNGQPEVINTKTLVIYGSGRGGGGGGLRGRGAAAPGGGAAARGPDLSPKLFALDKATGKELGAVSIPSRNSAVPMTFMHRGKQYIVFATGQGSSTGLIALALPRK